MQFGPNAHPTGEIGYLYLKYIKKVPEKENSVLGVTRALTPVHGVTRQSSSSSLGS
jgi:hypothetical protein